MAKDLKRPRPQKGQFRLTFLREWREFRGLTLEQLAARAGMSPANVAHIETGRQGYTQKSLEALAEALVIDVVSLLARRPNEDNEVLLAIWRRARPDQRRALIAVGKALVDSQDAEIAESQPDAVPASARLKQI